MTPNRRMVYDFFELSYPRRMQALRELDLLSEQELREHSDEVQLMIAAFNRAQAQGKVEKMREKFAAAVQAKKVARGIA